MKKFLIAASAVFVCFLISCSSKDAGGSGMSAKAKKNLETSHAIMDMFTTADFAKFTDYVTPDAIDHSGEHGEIKGAANIKDSLVAMCKKMTNMKNKVVKELADDEWVFSWTEGTATTTTADMGMPAGTTYTMNTIEASKFDKDGKVTDHWTFIGAADVMKMMMPAMQPMEMKPDTTHKM